MVSEDEKKFAVQWHNGIRLMHSPSLPSKSACRKWLAERGSYEGDQGARIVLVGVIKHDDGGAE